MINRELYILHDLGHVFLGWICPIYEAKSWAQPLTTAGEELNDLSVDDLYVDDVSVDDVSVDDPSVDDLSVDDISVDDLSVDDLSVDDISAQRVHYYGGGLVNRTKYWQ